MLFLSHEQQAGPGQTWERWHILIVILLHCCTCVRGEGRGSQPQRDWAREREQFLVEHVRHFPFRFVVRGWRLLAFVLVPTPRIGQRHLLVNAFVAGVFGVV